MRQSDKLNSLLRQSKKNIFIDPEDGQLHGASEDVTKNLFKVCCAIMNMRPKQRGKNPLDDGILWKYLDHVQSSDHETHIIDQLQTIRLLVSRKSFSLSENQILALHRKFQNLMRNRKEFLYKSQKKQTQMKVKSETKAPFSPKLNPQSVELDKTLNQSKSQSRSDLVYSYAEKHSQRRNELREVYKDKEKLKFQPKLNPKSLKIVEETHKTFTDRTMDQYISKHQRVDKDPDEIEYEKSAEQCTFQPLTSTSRPKLPQKIKRPVHRREDPVEDKIKQYLEKKKIDKKQLQMSHGGYDIPIPPATPKENDKPKHKENGR